MSEVETFSEQSLVEVQSRAVAQRGATTAAKKVQTSLEYLTKRQNMLDYTHFWAKPVFALLLQKTDAPPAYGFSLTFKAENHTMVVGFFRGWLYERAVLFSFEHYI